MTKKSTTVGTNELKLPFCTDATGFMSNMKRECARSIGRLSGNDKRLEDLLHTMEVLTAYAKEKHAWQKSNLHRAQAKQVTKAADAVAKIAAQKEMVMKLKKQELIKLKAEIAAHDKAVK